MGLTYCCLRFNLQEEPVVPNRKKRIYARVLRVLDGDTYECQFYYGFKQMRMKIRVYGIDTPEKSSKNEAGYKVTEYVKKYMESYGNMIEISIRDWDKYGGRLVAEVWVSGIQFGEHLIHKKLAKVYEGGKKVGWSEEELKQI